MAQQLERLIFSLSQPEMAYLLSCFAGAMVLFFLLERQLPRREGAYGNRTKRNIGLLVINTLLKVLLPVSLTAASLYALFAHFGVLNMLKAGLWTKIIIGWLVLDVVSYWLHRSYHAFSFFWRFHRVHHTDTAIDLTTPFRTHPVEMLFTLGVKALVIVAIGIPLLGVITYEIIVAVMAVWAHANVKVHNKLNALLAWVFVTPEFHLKHHGIDADSCKQNYGLVLTVWDQIFGTVAMERAGEITKAGAAYQLSKSENLIGLLLSPAKTPGSTNE